MVATLRSKLIQVQHNPQIMGAYAILDYKDLHIRVTLTELLWNPRWHFLLDIEVVFFCRFPGCDEWEISLFPA